MEGFHCENKGSVMVLHIEKEVDHHLADYIRKEVDLQIDRGDIKRIIFDFDGVNFMDSSGIGMIMGRYKKMQFFGGTVAVCRIGKGIDRIFAMSGLYKLVSKYSTIKDAMDGSK